MIYLVHTIKELADNTINTDFVIEAENEMQIKELMSECKIIVLGIIKVAGRPTSGQFFGDFQTSQNKVFKFCLKAESLESVCSRCIALELPIISINDNTNPITKEEGIAIIKKTVEARELVIKNKKIIAEKELQKNKNIMDDNRKEKIMSVIGETLKDISILEKENEEKNIPLEKKKKLHELKDLLTKIKMGSNLEKATSVLEETFILMEHLETGNLLELKEEEQKIMSSSTISNIDIMGELDKIKRANQTTEAGTKKTSSDLYYTYLGITGLYQKFILKDIISKLLEFKKILTHGIDYIAFGIINISIIIGLSFGYYTFHQTLNKNLLLSMITIGIFGIMRELPLAVRKSSFIISIIYIILAIIMSIVIYKLVVINFALV